MRRLLPLIFLMHVFFHGEAGLGQGRAALTHVQEVKALTNAQASQHLTVKIEATVTYLRPVEKNLFVIDNGVGIYVRFGEDIGLIPGDRIEVTGYTEPSFRPIVVAKKVRFLNHGSMPVAQPATFADLIRSRWDAGFVEVTGHVMSAALDGGQPYQSLRIRIKVPGGTVEGIVAHPGKLEPADLLDADVRMRGVAGGEFDSKMQMAGVWLDIDSWQEVTLLRAHPADSWSLPLIPMDEVVFAYRFSNESKRVRITGTLTYFEPGALAVVEQNGRSMLVKTNSTLPMHAGVGVEATGFPTVAEENVRLEDGELRPVALSAQIRPQIIDWEDASAGKYAYNLVAMEGEVVGLVHDSRVDLFIVLSEGHLFSATLRHTSSDAYRPASDQQTPTIGSRVRVSGVCFMDSGNHWRDRLWFDLRMRSLDDVAVLRQPSWWTVKRMAYIVTAMSAVILIAVLWAGMLDRRLRRQTAILAKQSQEDAIRERRLARQEQERSHILELISSSAPLPEVLREIQAMVSSRLYGVSCWFELHSGSEDGSSAERPRGPAIVFQELFSHEGASLGFILATPRLQSSAEIDISSALVAGARLAELAIDTRRLYSDLRHRSEYDLLTEIPNRFSMDRHLDQLMLSGRRSEAFFGLIYVDLDHFKQVNDRYGHRIGDLYLQEVTRRMKLQLRTEDVLARIGGDEFIALAPILRGRADAEEIAVRLERCFDELFELEGLRIHGSASVGLAVYPEDGSNKEELQRSADAAMYANKEAKREGRFGTVAGSRRLQQFGSRNLSDLSA
jgi:diguanylate cyclase (GGDEF)-like protein